MEPSSLVEQELALIPKIQEKAEEQRNLKVARYQNNIAVRAWRINCMRRVEKAQEDVTGVFSEDEYKSLNGQIKNANDELKAIETIEPNDAQKINEIHDQIKNILSKLKKINGYIKSKNYEMIQVGETFNALIERYNELQQKFEIQRRNQKYVEEKNETIKESNAKEDHKYEKYLDEIYLYEARMNGKLGELVSNGKYVSWNENKGELEKYDDDDVAQDWASYIVEHSQSPWGGLQLSILEELPKELRDFLDEAGGIGNYEWITDLNFLKVNIKKFIELSLNSEKIPTPPTLQYEKTEKIPEIKLTKMKTSDLLIDEIPTSQIRKTGRIPEDVVEEWENYRTGKYEKTIQNADRINEIAEKYNLLKIEVEKNVGKQSVREINSLIRELKSIQDAFGDERNSKVGERKINEFIAATNALLAHTRNQLKVFDQYYDEFNASAESLKDWINGCWWQFGGQPENHHGAGKGDNSKITKQKRSLDTEYSGPTF